MAPLSIPGGLPVPVEVSAVSPPVSDKRPFFGSSGWLSASEACDLFYYLDHIHLTGTLVQYSLGREFRYHRNNQRYTESASWTDPENPEPQPTILSSYTWDLAAQSLWKDIPTGDTQAEDFSDSIPQSQKVDITLGSSGPVGLDRIGFAGCVWDANLLFTAENLWFRHISTNYFYRHWRRFNGTFQPYLSFAYSTPNNPSGQYFDALEYWNITGFEIHSVSDGFTLYYLWHPVYAVSHYSDWYLSEQYTNRTILNSNYYTQENELLTMRFNWHGAIPFTRYVALDGALGLPSANSLTLDLYPAT